MKHLKPFSKLFESVDINDIKDILLELEENGFKIDIYKTPPSIVKGKPTRFYQIMIKSEKMRPVIFFDFTWYMVKDYIFRLMDYYYSTHEKVEIKHPDYKILPIYLPTGKRKVIKDEIKDSPFRLFGRFLTGLTPTTDKMIEFGIGFTSEEDFENAPDKFVYPDSNVQMLADGTRFSTIKILIKID